MSRQGSSRDRRNDTGTARTRMRNRADVVYVPVSGTKWVEIRPRRRPTFVELGKHKRTAGP